MDIIKKISELTDFARKNLSENRFLHSLNVAGTCAALCAKYGISDAATGFLAGISHDICKEFSDEKTLALASSDGDEISEIEREKPSLLHGRAAAVFLQKEFGIDSAELLESVANHTFGKAKMCDLANALFVADKIEPCRPQVCPEYLARLANLSLRELTYEIARENFGYVIEKGKKNSPRSLEFLRWLESHSN